MSEKKATALIDSPALADILPRLEGIQKALMAHHAAGIPLPSNAAGQEREIIVREFLGKCFPPHVRFSTGYVIDPFGRKTGQLDIVVARPFGLSIPALNTEVRLFLADFVTSIISVKSDCAKQWNQIESEAEKCLPLRRSGTFTGISFGEDINHIPLFVISYRGYSDILILKAKMESTAAERRPEMVLCIESGACVALEREGSKSMFLAGPLGLFGFLMWLSERISTLQVGAPNIGAYLSRSFVKE